MVKFLILVSVSKLITERRRDTHLTCRHIDLRNHFICDFVGFFLLNFVNKRFKLINIKLKRCQMITAFKNYSYDNNSYELEVKWDSFNYKDLPLNIDQVRHWCQEGCCSPFKR